MNTPAFISVFDLFKIGIGPSSSHTVGPMKAAYRFLEDLRADGKLDEIEKVYVNLYGSLALTGLGHGTDKALLLGLSGLQPDTMDPTWILPTVEGVKATNQLSLLGGRPIAFDPRENIRWYRTQNLPAHPNGMRFEAWSRDGQLLRESCYYSIGGGFITCDRDQTSDVASTPVPLPFAKGEDLLRIGKENSLKFWEIVLRNENALRSEVETRAGLQRIWLVMQDCIERGFTHEGILPGGAKVRRRAPDLHRALIGRDLAKDPLAVLDWVNLFAISVNEENAAFGRVVTAPTNGAAGIIPACLNYYVQFVPHANDEGIFRFLLTAAAIGTLYKLNASISGAEVGCQGEVGVASSMAAGALTEVLGGSNEQIENAAEIAMEHHLGMTCDPVGGLVQIPCIERNAMGSIKAINAARLALQGDGLHAISLDRVIKTMWETGQDMSTKYKETSRGGLAVNVPEC